AATLAQQRIADSQTLIAGIDARVKAVQDAQSGQAANEQQAVKDRDQTIKDLETKLAAVRKDYTDKVFAPLAARADPNIDKAIQTLTSALRDAEGDFKGRVNNDLVAKELSKANMMIFKAMAAGDLCHKLDALKAVGSQQSGGQALLAQAADLFETKS